MIIKRLGISMTRISLAFLAGFFLLTSTAIAENTPDDDRFHVRLGYTYGSSETEMQLNPKGFPAGLMINTVDTLGMDPKATTPRLDFYWRYHPKHRLELTAFRIRRTGTKTLEEEIDWGGETYPVGATVESTLNTGIFRVGYAWSFYRSEKTELGIGGGLYVMDIEAGIAGETLNSPRADVQSTITAPLPVASFYLGYNITDRWLIDYRSDFFALKVDQYEGTFTDNNLNISYRFTQRWSIGGGININRLNVTAKDDEKKLRLNNDVRGLNLFVGYKF